jgi:signal transduction histidine kinase/ligand-binding sensor domain-containing protein
LSESSVRGIAEDSKGFMWFATEDGLNKFDGYRFTVYKNNPADTFSISNNSNKSILNDSRNNLWIVTRNGLNLYDQEKDRFYNYKSSRYIGLKPFKADVEAICEDQKGHFWVACGTSGLFHLLDPCQIPAGYRFNSQDNGNILISVAPDPDGNILVGTRDGLLKFDVSRKEFIDLRPLYGKGYHVRSIHIDKNKNIWLSTTEGLKIIDAETHVMREYKHNPDDPFSPGGNNTIAVLPYSEDHYLVAIDGSGIDYFNIKTGRFNHYNHEGDCQLSSNNVTSMLIDSKKDLWVGTFLNGINYSNPSTNLFALVHNDRHNRDGIRQGIITNFLKDRNGDFWISTDGGGLYCRKKDSAFFRNYQPENNNHSLPAKAVIRLFEDEDGLWITTYSGGMALYDQKKKTFKVFRHDPENLLSVSNNKLNAITNYNGKIWVSTFGTGISLLDKKSGKFHHYRSVPGDSSSIPSDWIYIFFKDHDNVLWLGTANGLSRYIPECDCFKTYYFDKGEGIAEKNYIYDIYQNSQNNLWLASMGAGLISFDKHSGEFHFYTTENGLSSNSVKSIVEDNFQNLWLATNNGVTKFDLNTRSGKPYTIQDGVPAASFYFNSEYKDPSGNIYFGSNSGYLVIDPKNAKNNLLIPPVYLTDLKVFNRSFVSPDSNGREKENINNLKKVCLPYYQNALTMEFAALNFNNSQKNHYEYILEGFEKNWTPAGTRRTVTYTNLDPGTYHFRFKGSNNDQIWNPEPQTLEIIILPPYWKTWWFICGEFILLVLILYSIYRWRLKSVQKQNAQLEETILVRTKELKDSNEQLEAFVYKASHDIKGPLRSIIGLTTVGQKDVKDETALVYFQHILLSTKKLDKLLVDLLQVAKVKQANVKSEKINFEELVNDAISKFRHLPGFESVEIIRSIDVKADFYSDQHLMYSVVQNLIENPIKYHDPSKNQPFLKIEIEVTRKNVQLRFSDNGIGIPKEYHSKVFDMFFKVDEVTQGTGLGLYIVRTTVEKLGGKISMTSKPGEGTDFVINFNNN